MVASATNPRYAGLDQYMKIGWVAADKEREGASKTLEYAFDDWTIARAASAMGRADIARQFDARARQLAQCVRLQDRLHPRPQQSMGGSAIRSIPPLRDTTAITPKVMPGSTLGMCLKTPRD